MASYQGSWLSALNEHRRPGRFLNLFRLTLHYISTPSRLAAVMTRYSNLLSITWPYYCDPNGRRLATPSD